MADRAGMGRGARVRALARQEQEKLPDGEGRESKEEGRREKEVGADFSGAVLTSQAK